MYLYTCHARYTLSRQIHFCHVNLSLLEQRKQALFKVQLRHANVPHVFLFLCNDLLLMVRLRRSPACYKNT